MLPNLIDSRQIATQLSIEQIIKVFKDPHVHPKEALLLVGIGFIIALIFTTLIALIFVKTPKKKEALVRKKLTKENKLTITLSLLELFFVISIIAITSLSIYTDQPAYCRNCHEMKNAFFSWETSTHSKISCMRCHQVPGTIGYITQKATLFQMILAARSKTYEKPILAYVDNKSCLQCHKKEISRITASLGIRVQHRDFLDKGYQCTQCHNTVGHKGKVANPRYPSMDSCAICHNDQQTSARCSLCHASDIGENKRAEREDFPRVQLAPAPCSRCHSIEPCNQCHGLEMPHPPSWTDKATHAKESAWEKKEVCKKCHDMEFCNDCHNFPGHDPNFKQEHGKVATRESQEGCRGCHHKLRDNKDYCGLCHP